MILRKLKLKISKSKEKNFIKNEPRVQRGGSVVKMRALAEHHEDWSSDPSNHGKSQHVADICNPSYKGAEKENHGGFLATRLMEENGPQTERETLCQGNQ